MGEAIFGLVAGISLGGAVVWLVSAAILARFHQRCTRLEMAYNDLLERLTSLKGKEMSEKRWNKRDTEDLEMAQILKQAKPTSRRYDNDPLGEV